MRFGWWCCSTAPSGRCSSSRAWLSRVGARPGARGAGMGSVHPPVPFLRLPEAARRCGGCCVLSMAELIYRQTNTHCYSERRFPSDSFPFF